MDRDRLKEDYQERKREIKQRLEDFKDLRDAPELRKFQELVFVILSSQNSAENSWQAAQELENRGLLLEGSESEMASVIAENDISYEENKASYIVENRENLSQPTLSNPTRELKISDRIDPDDLEKTRDEMVDQLKGIGYKGASHFLRNIGYGNSFAIISGHISRKMVELQLIENSHPPKNREEYLEREQKLQEFSKEIDIPIQELDLLLWAAETGEVFK